MHKDNAAGARLDLSIIELDMFGSTLHTVLFHEFECKYTTFVAMNKILSIIHKPYGILRREPIAIDRHPKPETGGRKREKGQFHSIISGGDCTFTDGDCTFSGGDCTFSGGEYRIDPMHFAF